MKNRIPLFSPLLSFLLLAGLSSCAVSGPVGRDFQWGDFAFRVVGIETVDDITYLGQVYSAGADKRYVQVRISEINDGEIHNYLLLDQSDRPVLKDGAGRTYTIAFESLSSTDAPEAKLGEPMTSVIRALTYGPVPVSRKRFMLKVKNQKMRFGLE